MVADLGGEARPDVDAFLGASARWSGPSPPALQAAMADLEKAHPEVYAEVRGRERRAIGALFDLLYSGAEAQGRIRPGLKRPVVEMLFWEVVTGFFDYPALQAQGLSPTEVFRTIVRRAAERDAARRRPAVGARGRLSPAAGERARRCRRPPRGAGDAAEAAEGAPTLRPSPAPSHSRGRGRTAHADPCVIVPAPDQSPTRGAMLFPTVQFAIFFVVVFTGNWLLMQRPRPWRWFILAASYFFYGFWDWRFTFLLAGATLVNQFFAVRIRAARSPRARRWYLVGALVADLGVLGYFKYVGFLMASVVATLDKVGLHVDVRPLEVILPIGISFFTFQAMSYVIDVYREKIAPARWLDFAVYLSFFPHLVAGPIVRGAEFLPQLHPPRDPRHIDSSRAFYLIFIGLAKKIVIADFLASHIVDQVFASPGLHSGPEALFAIYAYAIQIYADFSAYSDIAIGLALLLGFRFPENFNAPYTAVSITDFWRRWHMTLSRWLRDYLYIPLGGQPGRPPAHLPQPDDHHAARRPLARGRLALRALGRAARPVAGRWSAPWSRAAGPGAWPPCPTPSGCEP